MTPKATLMDSLTITYPVARAVTRRAGKAVLAASLALVMLAMGARAPRAQAAGKPKKARVAVFMIPADGSMSPARGATLLLTMEDTLKRDRRLIVVDKDHRLARRAGKVPENAISEARGALRAGEELLRQDRAQAAVIRLEAARRQLVQVLAYVSKDELARAQFLTGAAHAIAGNAKQAEKVFRELLVWRPEFVADTRVGPDKVMPAWHAAERAVRRRPKGTLKLTSEPDGAIAYLNGQFVGFTPTSLDGLTVGKHYVTIKMNGHRREVAVADVNRKEDAWVAVALDRSEQFDQMAGLVQAVAANLDAGQAPPAVVELGDLLEVEQVLIVQVPGPRDQDASYVAAIYDTRTRMRLAQVTAPVIKDQSLETLFGGLARSLYAQVDVAARAAQAAQDGQESEGSGSRPIHARWWFWAGMTVAVGAAVAVPLVLSQSDSGGAALACPSGSTCGTVVWRY